MKTLLRIDASIRLTGSHTRALTTYFVERWLGANPGGKVIQRCLTTAPVPHLSEETLETFDNPGPACALSDQLIAELRNADHILLGSPLYNLSLPSTLKAYLDHVVRSGVTFEERQGAYRGLLEGKCATVITARSSESSPDRADDFQTGYLTRILAFMGIDDVEVVALDGTGLDEQSKAKAMARARRQIDLRLDPLEPRAWLGEFHAEDKDELRRLRRSQADAITRGDAGSYAALCTEDIQLLIPARDVISGTKAFMEVETALFRRSRFVRFRKFPLRVERSGDLAIEVGRQEVETQNAGDAGGVFAATQKYTHVFRRTERGWRFAVLMSNPSE
ncbi:MAG: NAD(P)H-dependent oxidoreductase [Myxococcota bacterium]